MSTTEEAPGTEWHGAVPGSVPTTAAAARGQVKEVLARYSAETGQVVSPEACYDVLLAVSELVTNALRHGAGLSGFRTTVANDVLRVEVADHSTTEPHTPAGRDLLTGAGGMGWPIVRAVADQVHVSAGLTGKTIVATFPLA
ncbi:ATP-binding protein [Streptomyces sp. PTM05]|uniref:ATP-binding protein n=1 Tax=Streptantibioticus parmotrematis TaxID=2873249 RepID=A0ABS7R1K7_9ACTN|nr:ATP-binding protein [Streptantibioticus parmotrematis]MBY8889342.1 ATP-binding protein [Streptantibioticus parmotrematis]